MDSPGTIYWFHPGQKRVKKRKGWKLLHPFQSVPSFWVFGFHQAMDECPYNLQFSSIKLIQHFHNLFFVVHMYSLHFFLWLHYIIKLWKYLLDLRIWPIYGTLILNQTRKDLWSGNASQMPVFPMCQFWDLNFHPLIPESLTLELRT